MAKDKMTERDARLFWETVFAAALSNSAHGDAEGDFAEKLADSAEAIADEATARWAETWGYDGELPTRDEEEGD